MSDKEQYCGGCRNDYYNHDGNGMGGGKCWSLKDAQVVTRYKLGWWTQPLNAQCFTKVTTLTCHHAPGRYALYTELPAHCRTKTGNSKQPLSEASPTVPSEAP